jgi:hypothetical protein
MGVFRRWSFWVAAITIYWFCARWLLHRVSPIYDDGYGLSASFFWGSHPPQNYPELLYPYWVATSIITFVGCGLTPWLVRYWRPRHSRLFLVSSATALLLLLLAGAISDAGTALHFWRGPAMYEGIYSILPFLKILAPMSLLSGILLLARDRLEA